MRDAFGNAGLSPFEEHIVGTLGVEVSRFTGCAWGPVRAVSEEFVKQPKSWFVNLVGHVGGGVPFASPFGPKGPDKSAEAKFVAGQGVILCSS